MSIDEAIAYHSAVLTECDAEALAEYGDDTPTISTTFQFVEIEVPAPRAARAS